MPRKAVCYTLRNSIKSTYICKQIQQWFHKHWGLESQNITARTQQSVVGECMLE